MRLQLLMLVKNPRRNVIIGVVYKKSTEIKKKINENILILILEILYDFICEEGQDLFSYLFGYQ